MNGGDAGGACAATDDGLWEVIGSLRRAVAVALYNPRLTVDGAKDALHDIEIGLEKLTVTMQELRTQDQWALEETIADLELRLVQEHAASVANARLLDEASQLAHNLTLALESRGDIEQAKGILMAREHCTPDEAFDILRRASQRQNQKLREVARELIARNRPEH